MNPSGSPREPCAEADAPQGSLGKLILPEAPATERGPVKAWEEAVQMRTWLPEPPDRNPLFLEKRVYQGSSGRVYPLPVTDRIASVPQERAWDAVHLENKFVRLMILPEIGGRIHVGMDRINGYDFFYRQNVIKPALVGLAGPWISGGVEFNWPQHHRPATFLPVDVSIERDPDGSVTVWCSDYDPMTRLKGSHGVCLHPGQAIVELRVRLYNSTEDTHTFLWWANVATHVHEKYQSFFPRDAAFVADHAKRAVTEFPLSQGTYYGVNYAERTAQGVPEEEQPRCFRPDGGYPPNDLGWYANIPVPTSYMIVGSRGDFFGGYDHRRQAGVVHVANHHIAPGKKQWTWGNHEFGYAWDRSLTESDGPYVELMAGVYTDNQPDFSFLAPGETKSFRQWWYPIRSIGVPDEANLHGALRLERAADRVTVHLLATGARPGSTVRLRMDGVDCGAWQGDLTPENPLTHCFEIGSGEQAEVVWEQGGRVLLRYAPAETVAAVAPPVATEPPAPEATQSNDELYLTGLHLEQYRHPTRAPELYWHEALRRDPGDSRCHNAMGRWRLRRGEFAAAEQHLRAAVKRLTERNPNPADGEAYYHLGRTLLFEVRTEEAYAAFYKATWNAAWRGPAHHRLAEIDCSRGEWEAALEHLERSLRAETENLNARNLKVVVLRRLARRQEADEALRATRALDALDVSGSFLETGRPPRDGQQRLDLAFLLLRAGLMEEAAAVAAPAEGYRDAAHGDAAHENDFRGDGSAALLLYVRGWIFEQQGKDKESAAAYREAENADARYVFPSRLEEMVLLEHAIGRNPRDARAPYYLGNLLYDRRRGLEAIRLWESATALDPDFPTAWRNLAFGYYNVLKDAGRAAEAFARARAADPADARILFEQDQLAKRTGTPPAERLAALEGNRALVEQRDDLSAELATLYNSVGRPEEALRVLRARTFQPWEGGEGVVLGQFVRAHLLLAEKALAERRFDGALRGLREAVHPPENLGEAHHLLVNLGQVEFWLGVTHASAGDAEQARRHWERAARSRGDFQQMRVQPISEMTRWSALALQKLGREDEAEELFRTILEYGVALESESPALDYFATSLPAMLLFDEDLKERQTITARFLQAQGLLGLGKRPEGLERLRAVLRMDENHGGAVDLLRAEEG